jgi:hypothetical protein
VKGEENEVTDIAEELFDVSSVHWEEELKHELMTRRSLTPKE